MWPPSSFATMTEWVWASRDTFRQDVQNIMSGSTAMDGINWWMVALGLLLVYGMAELVFFLVVYWIWLPRLNQPEPVPEPRHFREQDQRHKLFERLILRQEKMCRHLGLSVDTYFAQFCRNWFFVEDEIEEEELAVVAASDDESSASGSSRSAEKEQLACIRESGLPCKDDLDKLLSWAFFGVDVKDFTEEWQHRELHKMYQLVKDRHGMEPGPRTKQKLLPAQMTIEPLDPRHRLLITYFLFFICRQVLLTINRLCGFQCLTTSSGLTYWYRPAKAPSKPRGRHAAENPQPKLPLLFFHGIAPAGCAFYIPFMLWGLAWAKDDDDTHATDDRPIFLFENPAVAFRLTSQAPTEQETVDGVWEAVDTHLGKNTEVSIIGHSFGTCLQTYIIYSSQAHRVRQLVLIDPVSLLLSEPDVITNFVYGKSHKRANKLSDNCPSPGSAGWVMNELFIEHFLRRQFFWYRGELFLEDVPNTCKVIVCLSEQDEITNSPKIKSYIDICNGDNPNSTYAVATRTLQKGGSTVSSVGGDTQKAIDLIYWRGEGMGHGWYLFEPKAWKEIRTLMRKQEHHIFKKKAL